MEWADEGVVLSTRPYGETSAVAEVFTEDHGRHLGLVRGARGKRLAPAVQIANLVRVGWRARLPEQLGVFQVELLEPHAARALDDPLRLTGAASLCSLARLLPERAPHPALYRAFRHVLAQLEEPSVWPALTASWELMLLDELGFGLDLESCAATGTRENLTYVSPRSGQAVCAAAAAPYKDRLLPLPPYLRRRSPGVPVQAPTPKDVADALRLTGYFLEKRAFMLSGARLPEARVRLLAYLSRTER
jgi:DNA repair protein RecO (recombination protein O)